MSNSLQPHGHTHSSLSPRVCSNSCPLSQWCYLPISSSFAPSPLALNLSQHQCVFQWVSFAHQVAKVLKLQLQHQYFQWYLVFISYMMDWFDLLSPRDSRVSPTPQFKSISSVLSLLYGPTLISIHDYWKSQSFDYMYLYQQSVVSAL